MSKRVRITGRNGRNGRVSARKPGRSRGWAGRRRTPGPPVGWPCFGGRSVSPLCGLVAEDIDGWKTGNVVSGSWW